MKNKGKKVIRMLPCPSYDIERVESWLGDMAKEGLMLDRRSPLASAFIRFVPGPPRTVRYRLEPKAKGAEYAGEPPAEARELAKEYGWEFVCPFEEFYIYRTDRTDAPEMNTDLAVQAASLKRLKRQLVIHLLCQFLIIGNTFWNLFREPYRYLVTLGSLYVLLCLLFFGGALVYDLLRITHIFRLQRNLKKQVPMDHGKPWKPQASFRKTVRITAFCVMILTFSTLFYACGKAVSSGKPSTFDYPGNPPFVTVSDLYPDCTLTDAGLGNLYNHYESLSSDCCSLMLDWREYVHIETADGQNLGTETMIVQYYETAAPWIARGLAQDFLRRDAQWKSLDTLEWLPAPELGLDYVAVYQDLFPCIVIQHGNVMVHATISDTALLYEWAAMMAEVLKNP